MKTKLFISILIFILTSCGVNNLNPLGLKDCNNPNFKLISLTEACNNDKCGYYHCLMLDEYKEDCFDDYDFVYLADKYLDSVKNNLPVKGIIFVKPFEFKSKGDSRDFDPIDKHSIVSIDYSDSTMKNKVPEITSISIWSNGIRKDLQYMYVTFREKRMEYYNSQKK